MKLIAAIIIACIGVALIIGALLLLLNPPDKLSKKRVLAAIKALTDEQLRDIASLRQRLSMRLPQNYFQILCVTSMLAFDIPISELEEIDSLSGRVDSRDWIVYIMHLEELVSELQKEQSDRFEISPADAEGLLTFEDVVCYVEESITPANA
jgi:hypothetical protein